MDTTSLNIMIQIVTIGITIGVFVGTSKTTTKSLKDFFNVKMEHVDSKIANIKEDINRLERKQDKYNHLQERTTVNEKVIETICKKLDGK